MTLSSQLFLSCTGCNTGTGFESGCVESCSISPSCPLVLVLGNVFGLLFGPERTKELNGQISEDWRLLRLLLLGI